MSRVVNYAISLASLIVVLLLLESLAYFDIVDYRLVFNNLSPRPWRNPLNRLDPELLHVHRPNITRSGVQIGGDIAHQLLVPDPREHRFAVRYDSHGFRNPADLDAAAVAVVGDSFVESVLTPQPELLTSRLADELGVPVSNLGQLWYGPQQIRAVVSRYAVPLSPKVVVWGFFAGNDLTDYYRYARARAEWDERAPTFHGFGARSFVRNAGSTVRRLLAPRGPTEPAPSAECPPGTMYFFYPDVPLSEDDLRALDATVALIADAEAELAAKGARLVVALLPTKAMVYRDLCRFPPSSPLAQWTGSGMTGRLEAALAERAPDVDLVDLTPALREAARHEAVYLVDDTHWTSAGHRAVAEALAPRLRPYLDR